MPQTVLANVIYYYTRWHTMPNVGLMIHQFKFNYKWISNEFFLARGETNENADENFEFLSR